MSNDKSYCGIIFVGTGSTWHWGSTPEEAAKETAKWARKDWGAWYKFPKTLKIMILDMRERNGWYADHRGIFDKDTNEEIEVMKVIEV